MNVTLSRQRLGESGKNELRKLAEQSNNQEIKDILLHLSKMRTNEVVTICEAPKDLTPNEAANLLGVSRTYVNKLISDGELQCYKVGSHKRIPFGVIESFMNQREAASRAFAEETATLQLSQSQAVRELMELL